MPCVNARITKDGVTAQKKMPFDCKRMAYGGFKVLADAWSSPNSCVIFLTSRDRKGVVLSDEYFRYKWK